MAVAFLLAILFWWRAAGEELVPRALILSDGLGDPGAFVASTWEASGAAFVDDVAALVAQLEAHDLASPLELRNNAALAFLRVGNYRVADVALASLANWCEGGASTAALARSEYCGRTPSFASEAVMTECEMEAVVRGRGAIGDICVVVGRGGHVRTGSTPASSRAPCRRPPRGVVT